MQPTSGQWRIPFRLDCDGIIIAKQNFSMNSCKTPRVIFIIFSNVINFYPLAKLINFSSTFRQIDIDSKSIKLISVDRETIYVVSNSIFPSLPSKRGFRLFLMLNTYITPQRTKYEHKILFRTLEAYLVYT